MATVESLNGLDSGETNVGIDVSKWRVGYYSLRGTVPTKVRAPHAWKNTQALLQTHHCCLTRLFVWLALVTV